MLLAAGVGGLELSGRLAGVISSWVGDLFGSLGSGVGILGAARMASITLVGLGGGGSMRGPWFCGGVGSGLTSLRPCEDVGSSSSSRSMTRGLEEVVGV